MTMEFDEKGLFNSALALDDEHGQSLQDTFEYDYDRYNTLKAKGKTSYADDFLIDNSMLTLHLGTRIEAYSTRSRLPRKLFKTLARHFDDRLADMNQRTVENLAVIDRHSATLITKNIGRVMLRPIESGLYPMWHPSRFELMHRFAAQNAWLHIYREFIGNRFHTRPERRERSAETNLETMVSLSSAVVALSMVSDSAVRQAKTLREKDMIKSAEGFTNEIDTLGSVAFSWDPQLPKDMEIPPIVPTSWIMPSPFINDMAGHKADIVHLGVELATGKIFMSIFDVKLSKGKKEIYLIPRGQNGRQAVRINAYARGAVDDHGQPMAGKHGLDFHAQITEAASAAQLRSMEVQDVRLTTTDGAVAHGLALANVVCADYIRV